MMMFITIRLNLTNSTPRVLKYIRGNAGEAHSRGVSQPEPCGYIRG